MVQIALKEVRKKRGEVSLYRLEKDTKINLNTLRNYDSGRPVTVRLEHLDILCERLKCKLTDLIVANGKKP